MGQICEMYCHFLNNISKNLKEIRRNQHSVFGLQLLERGQFFGSFSEVSAAFAPTVCVKVSRASM